MALLLLLLSLLLGGSQAQKEGYSASVPKSVTVQKGLCVLVPCSFSYPEETWNLGPAHGYWFRANANTDTDQPVASTNQNKAVQSATKDRFQLVGDPHRKDCTLVIRDAQWGDKGDYFFRIEIEHTTVKFNYKTNMFLLSVRELSQKPDVFIPETLEAGKPVTIHCVFNWVSTHCPAPAFSWTGTALASQHSSAQARSPDSLFSTFSLTPAPQDHDTELTCRVSFSKSGISTQRTVRLSVTYAPEDPVISTVLRNGLASESKKNVRQLEVHEGQLLQLACTADPWPPTTLSWALEDRVLSWSQPWGPRTLKLELQWVKATDSGHYTCRAENKFGSRNQTLELSVLYSPEDPRVMVSQANSSALQILRNGTSLPVLEGQSLRLACVTHSRPPARLSWAQGTQILRPAGLSEPGVLELPQVHKDHDGEEFTCHAENPLGARSVSLSLSVHYAPQLPGPSCSWEAEGLRCSCSSHAQPVPSLRWWLGDRLLEGNSSNASFRVTSSSAGSWVNSSLSLPEGLSPGLRLSCEAQNDHGTQSATVLLLPDRGQASTVLSKEVFLGVGITVLLFLIFGLILVKTLRTTRTQAETPKPKFSRSSTILDYVNVIPKARNRKATPSSPSQTSSPRIHTPEPKKNQNVASLDCTEPLSSTGAPNSEISSEDLHYATVNFSALRPWKTQKPQDAHVDYAEIRFY